MNARGRQSVENSWGICIWYFFSSTASTILVTFLPEEIFLHHAAANRVVEILKSLKSLDSNFTVEFHQVSVP